jgi:hypothetical protein
VGIALATTPENSVKDWIIYTYILAPAWVRMISVFHPPAAFPKPIYGSINSVIPTHPDKAV